MKSLRQRTRSVFIWVLVVPIALGMLTLWAAGRYRNSLSWVSHTKDVLVAVQDLLVSITDAESKQRGFLLTGEEPFRASYQKAKAGITGKLAHLHQLTSDNPSQQANLRRLSVVLQARITRMDQVLTLRSQDSLPESRAIEWMRDRTVLMNTIREICSQMTAEEERLLSVRHAQQQRIELEVGLCFTLGILASVLLLYSAHGLIQENANQRDAAESKLLDLNSELESRVEERTAELEEINQQLIRSNRDLTQFAYVASHDLQEPLRTVGSYAGLLGRKYKGKLDQQADTYICFLVDAAKRMQSLVQDLLAYSRAGTEALRDDLVDLGLILVQAKENLKVAIAERSAQITNDPLPNVRGDAGRLTQVFQNLIGNALKFGKPGESVGIHVAAYRHERDWTFVISDNGIGFEPEYAERIFVIFQRLHPVGAYTGTGMGLAICKRIIDAHGGRIWGESQPGLGSKFFFTLPAERRSKSTKPESSDRADVMRRGRDISETARADLAS